MSQSFWEPETLEQEHTEQEHTDQSPQEPAAAIDAVTLSVDDFSALEERILRTVGLVKREREARAAAEEHAAQVEAQLREQLQAVDQSQKELQTLRAEREHVRQRVERLLAQLDSLEV